MLNLKVETFEPATKYSGIPKVISVQYDLWLLTVTLSFPKQSEPIYLRFKCPKGFRVLDEGDLLDFWNPKTRATGWLWHIKSGGWFDLESSRGDDFVSGKLGEYTEYLVLGSNDCVSVITNSQPEIDTLS